VSSQGLLLPSRHRERSIDFRVLPKQTNKQTIYHTPTNQVKSCPTRNVWPNLFSAQKSGSCSETMVRAAESEGEPTDHQSAATPYTPHESPATQHGADLGERPLQPQPHSAPGDVCRQRLFSSPERGTRQHAARLHEAQQPAAQQPEVPAPSATPLLDRRAVAQAHEHPHSEARTRDPYSCSAGGVLKPEVRELFKHLLQTGFIKQLPSRQPKLQLPDMSPVDSAGQACYFTAHHVSEKLSVWETSKQVKVPRCAWAVKAGGVQSSVEILLQQLLWLVPAHQPTRKRAPPAGSHNGRKRPALDREKPTVIMPTPALQPQPTQTSNSATQPRVCFFLPPLFL